MQIIDSHQHFWTYNEDDFSWIDDTMSIIKRDFLPNDYLANMQRNNIVGSVVVQARQSDAETHWLLQQSEQYDFILGVVGWIDLKSTDLENQLIAYKKHSKLKGFRHVIHDEPDINFMLDPNFIKGLTLLEKYDYSYDLLIKSEHLDNTIKLLKQLPSMRIVIDHIAKPNIKMNEWKQWAVKMKYIAENFQHVQCKLSGVVTEADWSNWNDELIQRYINEIINLFGTQRVMFGSDWPVCQVAAPLDKVIELCINATGNINKSTLEAITYNNANKFYQL